MLRLPFVAILFATTFSHSSAQTVTTTRLHEWCSSQSGTTEDTSCTAFMAGGFTGFLYGQTTGGLGLCPPNEVTSAQMRQIIESTPTITLNSWISRPA